MDGLFAKVIVLIGILQDAPIAQIRGEFINWNGLFAKVVGLLKLRCETCSFYKKTEHIN